MRRRRIHSPHPPVSPAYGGQTGGGIVRWAGLLAPPPHLAPSHLPTCHGLPKAARRPSSLCLAPLTRGRQVGGQWLLQGHSLGVTAAGPRLIYTGFPFYPAAQPSPLWERGMQRPFERQLSNHPTSGAQRCQVKTPNNNQGLRDEISAAGRSASRSSVFGAAIRVTSCGTRLSAWPRAAVRIT